MQEYPKWLPVDGPGHVNNPGHVLVENEDQEAEALATGKGPAALNPEPGPGDEGHEKPIEDMSRSELIETLVRESITDDVTDDQLREGVKANRDRIAKKGDEPAPDDDDEHDDGEALEDSAGEKIAPPVDQEANKGADLGPEGRTLPEAKAQPATDARPDEAKDKEPDSKPAGNITEQAATPPAHKRGARRPRSN